jgi:hypothetical protein
VLPTGMLLSWRQAEEGTQILMAVRRVPIHDTICSYTLPYTVIPRVCIYSLFDSHSRRRHIQRSSRSDTNMGGHLPFTESTYAGRTAQWVMPPLSDVVIEAVVMPLATGTHVGIIDEDNTLQVLRMPEKEHSRHDVVADSRHLFRCVATSVRRFNVSIGIKGVPYHVADLLGNNVKHTVYREIVHGKRTTDKCLSYTMVQLFHQEMVDRDGTDPVTVTFMFYVMTPYARDPFIVQRIHRHSNHEDNFPFTGYELAKVPVLSDDISMCLVHQFLFARSTNGDSLCGLDPFVIVPLTATPVEDACRSGGGGGDNTGDGEDGNESSDGGAIPVDDERTCMLLDGPPPPPPSAVRIEDEGATTCGQRIWNTTDGMNAPCDTMDQGDFDQLLGDHLSDEPWLSYNWDNFEYDAVSMMTWLHCLNTPTPTPTHTPVA